jgi:hypothetical protein
VVEAVDLSQAALEEGIDAAGGVEEMDIAMAIDETLGEIEDMAAGAAARAFDNEEDAEGFGVIFSGTDGGRAGSRLRGLAIEDGFDLCMHYKYSIYCISGG